MTAIVLYINLCDYDYTVCFSDPSCIALLVLIVSMYIVGTIGIALGKLNSACNYNFLVCSIPLGARMIAVVDDCSSMSAVTNKVTGERFGIGVAYVIYVLLVGVALNFIAVYLSLLTPYSCCRLFGKCQHRGWRIPLCISVPLGICSLFIALAIVIYSIAAGASFYPLTQHEPEIPGCIRIHYYSTFIFLLFTHVVSSVLIVVVIIILLIMLIRRTICT